MPRRPANRTTDPVPAIESAEVTLILTEERPGSWRFDAPERAEGEPKPPVRFAYISKPTYEALGRPGAIRMSIATATVE